MTFLAYLKDASIAKPASFSKANKKKKPFLFYSFCKTKNHVFILLSTLLFLSTTTSYAQVLEDWVTRYDPKGFNKTSCMVIDAEGNVYVTGRSYYSEETLFDYATVKYNASGVQQWVATYNGPGNGYDIASSLAVDAEGNVYVTGHSYKIDPHESYDYVTIKYNPLGEEQWVKRFSGSSGTGDDEATSITLDTEGNVYVTGHSEDELNFADYTTVKYNSSGEEQWVAQYNGPGIMDFATSVLVDGKGNVYVTGHSTGSESSLDYATVKYNSSGEEQWVARYNGLVDGWDEASSIAVDSEGNVYVTGKSEGEGTSFDYATIKYTPYGEEQWVKRYNGSASKEDEPKSIAVDAFGNVYVTGSSTEVGKSSDFTTIKYTPSGQEQWIANYNGPAGGNDMAISLALDPEGNIYVGGSSTGNGTDTDYATLKYNPSGQEQWVARHNGPGNGIDELSSIAVDQNGNVYLAGFSEGNGTSYDYATIKYSQGSNLTPVAEGDSYRTSEDVALTVAAPGVLINDTDKNGDVLTAALVAGPSNGSLALKPDGSFTYMPDKDFYGSDSFTYTAHDGKENSNPVTVDIAVSRLVRMNAGGSAYTSGNGKVFDEEQYYSTSEIYSNTGLNIEGTSDDVLYQSQRLAPNFSFNIPVPVGTYLVRLHFAEIQTDYSFLKKGIFDVLVEDLLLMEDFNGYDAIPYATAVVEEMEVAVKDGIMNLDFIASFNEAKVSAIEVIQLSSTIKDFPPTVQATWDRRFVYPNTTTTLYAEATDREGNITSYAWTLVKSPSGNTATFTGETTSHLEVMADLAGTYTFEVTVTDEKGATASDQIDMIVNSAPIADAGPDQTIIAGSDGTASVVLDGSGSSDPDGDLISWNWQEEGITIGTGKNPPVSLATGVHTITMSVKDKKGAISTDDVVVTVQGGFSPVRTNTGGGEFISDSGIVFPEDQYYNGTSKTYSKTSLAIAGTTDDALYQTERYGNSFSYDIPVPAGTYLVKLHFAEIYWTNPGKRVFDVEVENKTWLTGFDIFAEAGHATAIVKELEIAVHDDTLNLDFIASVNNAKISAIEVVESSSPTNAAPVADAGQDQKVTAGSDSKALVTLDGSASLDSDGSIISYSWKTDVVEIATGVQPTVPLAAGSHIITLTVTDDKGATGSDQVIVTVQEGTTTFSPIRINAGGGEFTAGSGIAFAADEFYNGTSKTHSNTSLAIAGTTDDVLYQRERYGSSFSYDIPVPSGNYLVKLHFAEIYWTSSGKRVFDVEVEGNIILDKYDIFAEVGFGTATVKEIEVAVKDGMLNLNFAASVNNAKISAIEIVESVSSNSTLASTEPESLKYRNPEVEWEETLHVYPNPFQKELFIKIHRDVEGAVEVVLYDFAGRKLMEEKFEKPLGEHVENLQLGNSVIPQGIYFLKVIQAGMKERIFKLVKK